MQSVPVRLAEPKPSTNKTMKPLNPEPDAINKRALKGSNVKWSTNEAEKFSKRSQEGCP